MFGTRFVPALRSARAFSTTRPALADMAKATFIGRVGADPTFRETKDGKPYYTYPLGVSIGPLRQGVDGKTIFPDTFWHTIFAFNPNSHESIKRIGKGSTLYVEAELDMRNSEPIGDQFVPPRVVLRHLLFRTIQKKEAGVGDPTEAPEADE